MQHKLKTSLTIFFLLTFSIAIVAQEPPTSRVHITIVGTTDLHGNILPKDYYTEKAEGRGIAKAATIIRKVRQENPNLLLLDSGDTIQGTPLEFFHNKKNNVPMDPMMLVMNELGYDAMAVGNHEYNFGLPVLEKARHEAHFPWLSANTYDKASGKPHYQPYIVKEISGVRIGVLGLTTPGIPNWDNPQNYEGLEFREPLAEAKKWVPILRNKEHVDVIIIAMHMGLEEDLNTGILNPGQVANENQALTIARQVPGINVILMGHTHREVSSMIVNGVLLTQANYWGRHVTRVDLYIDKTGKSPRVSAEAARTLPVDTVEADPEIAKLAEPYDRETEAWLGRVIGQSSAELTARESRFQDTAILDLIQRVQLEAGHADVSMVASFNPQARIPKGPIKVREISGLYVYENTLVVLEVTGRQLKQALEHSAQYFRAYEPGKPVADLVDEKIPAYNFDIAEGVEYELDITKPFGQRIQKLTFKGKPVTDNQKFKLATNNYRVNGGGGYDMYKNAPVVYRSSELIRDLIIDWVERHKTIPTEPTNNWQIAPLRAGNR